MEARATRRIALFGNFGVENIGNEASLAAALAELRHLLPDAEFVVVCPNPTEVARLHSVQAAPMSMPSAVQRLPHWARLVLAPIVEPIRWLAAARFLRSVSGIVVPGTGALDDFGVAPHEAPYDLFRWSTAARWTRRPWTMVCIGAGPIERRASRFLMAQTARNSSLVIYRDASSLAFMQALGAATDDDLVCSDLAFALPRPSCPESRAPDGARIGLGLMAYYGWRGDPAGGAAEFDGYIATMVGLAASLIGSGHTIRLLVGQDSDDVAVRNFLSLLRDRLGSTVADVVTTPTIHDFDDLLEQIAMTDVVIASRYHNVIGGLMMGRPTMAIGYAPKFVDLMESFDLGDRCYDIDDLDVAEVVGGLEELLRDAECVGARISKIARHQGGSARAAIGRTVDELEVRRRSTTDNR